MRPSPGFPCNPRRPDEIVEKQEDGKIRPRKFLRKAAIAGAAGHAAPGFPAERLKRDADPALMNAAEATEAIRAGRITSEELVRACLDRIAALEERVGAWAFLDPGHALKEARASDRARRKGDVKRLKSVKSGASINVERAV